MQFASHSFLHDHLKSGEEKVTSENSIRHVRQGRFAEAGSTASGVRLDSCLLAGGYHLVELDSSRESFDVW